MKGPGNDGIGSLRSCYIGVRFFRVLSMEKVVFCFYGLSTFSNDMNDIKQG